MLKESLRDVNRKGARGAHPAFDPFTLMNAVGNRGVKQRLQALFDSLNTAGSAGVEQSLSPFMCIKIRGVHGVEQSFRPAVKLVQFLRL